MAQIVFTGNAVNDFDLNAAPSVKKTVVKIVNNNPLAPSAFMAAQSRLSGWDLTSTYVQYDYAKDILYAALDCAAICGDADGDGNAGSSSDPQALDIADLCASETISFLLWPTPPVNYNADGTSWVGFRPPVVFGVAARSGSCVSSFDAYTAPRYEDCPDEVKSDPEACENDLIVRFLSVGSNYGVRYFFRVRLNLFFLCIFSKSCLHFELNAYFISLEPTNHLTKIVCQPKRCNP